MVLFLSCLNRGFGGFISIARWFLWCEEIFAAILSSRHTRKGYYFGGAGALMCRFDGIGRRL